MAASTSATLGTFPPARAQGGAPRVAPGGSAPAERGTAHAAHVTGATYRQIDYWIRHGLLGGDTITDLGQGRRRRFTDADLEIITALAQLAALGCRGTWLDAAARTVRFGRVRPGEWLLLTLDEDVQRFASLAGLDLPDGPAWFVPLQAFDQGRPL